ncbi:MAG: hydroxymethylglutaryl-CoA reductase, degradative [Oligoflexales bacterium]|nr:hydroxymethylglutaryl-CoA reductase, degradative [Oligoflexales bacterium]
MEMVEGRSSRLPGFYALPANERIKVSAKISNLNDDEKEAIHQYGAISAELADTFIENAVGTYSLPLGIATNFLINEKDVLIPMAVEESSVLAAASHGAKLARYGHGFHTSSSDPIMTGQVQIFVSPDTPFDEILTRNKQMIIDYANVGQDRLINRGGGAQDLSWYYIPEIESLVLSLHIHTCDAMGANIVNTMCEKVSLLVAKEIFPGRDLGLRILSNLTDRRIAKATCHIPPEAFKSKQFSGQEVIERIYRAWQFAYYDIYRASTHNKGVMNGIDPVLIATGNDWRAIEAGAHAYCCKDGVYRPMTKWSITPKGNLYGELELPMAVGTVGGVTKLHPTAQAALKLLGKPNARELAEIICCVGLAQNLSALRALASEGIQQGHMALHEKNLDLLKKINQ